MKDKSELPKDSNKSGMDIKFHFFTKRHKFPAGFT